MTTATSSTGGRAQAPAAGRTFSCLACASLALWLTAALTLYDCYIYFEESRTIPTTVANASVAFVTMLGLHPVYGYGLPWWLLTGLAGGLAGWRHGARGLLYSVCAVVLCLAVMHLFRGIALRHNVFEMGDLMSRVREPGVPSAAFWDFSYFAAALAGTGIGLAVRRRRVESAAVQQASPAEVQWAALACVAAGLAEGVIALKLAGPNDHYPLYPALTHGYAVAALGAAAWIVVRFRDSLFSFELE